MFVCARIAAHASRSAVPNSGLPNFSVVGLKASLEVVALGSLRGRCTKGRRRNAAAFSDAVSH
jgi:hypothetical protein